VRDDGLTTDGRHPVDATRTRIARLELTAAAAGEALAIADACTQAFGTVEDAEFLRTVAVIAQSLPMAVRDAANEARLTECLHAFVIAGTLVDDDRLEPTPRHWSEAHTPGSRRYEFLLMLYAALLGDAIGWATQQAGRIVTDVLPIAGMEDSLVSASSRSELGWHTEDAFSPYRADHVGLLCLRSPDRTPTTLAYLDVAMLPAAVVEVLRQPRFHVMPDASHTAEFSLVTRGGGTGAFGKVEHLRRVPAPVALLDGPAEAPALRIDRDFMVAVDGDEEARQALRALVEHVDASVYDLSLAPGDACFIDNGNAAHGRRSFTPRYDGRDRWLKRVNTVRDLRRTRAGRASAGSRVIG
jgi:Fe(II)/alpha-ketoglutarate-dependent arginine beta-hydroxylase